MATVGTDLAYGTGLQYLLAVPVYALVAAVWTHHRAARSLDIHDRETDVIVGLLSCGFAVLSATLLGRPLSGVYFLWRIDLLMMCVFAFGASVVLFGLRRTLYYRWAWVVLLLGWPLLGRVLLYTVGDGRAATLALLHLGVLVAVGAVVIAVDVLLVVPSLLLSLSVIILLGFGTWNAALAVGVTSVATFARLARSQVLGVAASDFVEAAYGSGASRGQVLVRHILPNSLAPVIGLAAVQFGSALLQLATLGFLGYGAPPPTPEWGLLIAEARDHIATAWWLTILPGLVIVAVVVAANHLSQRIQEGYR